MSSSSNVDSSNPLDVDSMDPYDPSSVAYNPTLVKNKTTLKPVVENKNPDIQTQSSTETEKHVTHKLRMHGRKMI